MTVLTVTQPDRQRAGYRRRQPEATVLYRIVQQHLATFLARADADLVGDD